MDKAIEAGIVELSDNEIDEVNGGILPITVALIVLDAWLLWNS